MSSVGRVPERRYSFEFHTLVSLLPPSLPGATSYPTPMEGPVFLELLSCSGEEDSIFSCLTLSYGVGLTTCDSSQDSAGIQCLGIPM